MIYESDIDGFLNDFSWKRQEQDGFVAAGGVGVRHFFNRALVSAFFREGGGGYGGVDYSSESGGDDGSSKVVYEVGAWF